MSFMPDNQASKIAKPCNGSLNFPTLAISSQFSSILRFRLFTVLAMRDNQIDFNRLQSLSERVTVLGSICDQALRALFGASTTFTWHADPIQCFFGQGHFRGRCRGKGASQRNTLAVDHHHPLRSFAFFGLADASAPFFAGAKLPSMKASCQSSNPFSSRRDRNLRQISSQTPLSSHSRSRLQQVEGLGYRSGKSCHRAPVRRTQRMPSKTSRLSAGGRPLLGREGGFGSSGASNFQWSSFMKRVYLAIGAPPIA